MSGAKVSTLERPAMLFMLTKCSSCYNLKDLVRITISDPDLEADKQYEIPRGLLEWHSSYFAAALDPESDFYTSDSIHLEHSHEVFDAFVCWLYTGRIKDPAPIADDINACLKDHYSDFEVLIRVWTFSDMRGIPALGNAAVDAMHGRVAAAWASFENADINFVYSNTRKSSLLRKFVVDAEVLTMTFSGYLKELEDSRCDSNAEFLIEALPLLVKRGEGSKTIKREAWRKLDRCQWHDHSGPGGKLRLESRK